MDAASNSRAVPVADPVSCHSNTVVRLLFQTRLWAPGVEEHGEFDSSAALASPAEADLCRLAARISSALDDLTTNAAAAKEQLAAMTAGGPDSERDAHVAVLASAVDAAVDRKRAALESEAVAVDAALETLQAEISSAREALSAVGGGEPLLAPTLPRVQDLFVRLRSLPSAPVEPSIVQVVIPLNTTGPLWRAARVFAPRGFGCCPPAIKLVRPPPTRIKPGTSLRLLCALSADYEPEATSAGELEVFAGMLAAHAVIDVEAEVTGDESTALALPGLGAGGYVGHSELPVFVPAVSAVSKPAPTQPLSAAPQEPDSSILGPWAASQPISRPSTLGRAAHPPVGKVAPAAAPATRASSLELRPSVSRVVAAAAIPQPPPPGTPRRAVGPVPLAAAVQRSTRLSHPARGTAHPSHAVPRTQARTQLREQLPVDYASEAAVRAPPRSPDSASPRRPTLRPAPSGLTGEDAVGVSQAVSVPTALAVKGSLRETRLFQLPVQCSVTQRGAAGGARESDATHYFELASALPPQIRDGDALTVLCVRLAADSVQDTTGQFPARVVISSLSAALPRRVGFYAHCTELFAAQSPCFSAKTSVFFAPPLDYAVMWRGSDVRVRDACSIFSSDGARLRNLSWAMVDLESPSADYLPLVSAFDDSTATIFILYDAPDINLQIVAIRTSGASPTRLWSTPSNSLKSGCRSFTICPRLGVVVAACHRLQFYDIRSGRAVMLAQPMPDIQNAEAVAYDEASRRIVVAHVAGPPQLLHVVSSLRWESGGPGGRRVVEESGRAAFGAVRLVEEAVVSWRPPDAELGAVAGTGYGVSLTIVPPAFAGGASHAVLGHHQTLRVFSLPGLALVSSHALPADLRVVGLAADPSGSSLVAVLRFDPERCGASGSRGPADKLERVLCVLEWPLSGGVDGAPVEVPDAPAPPSMRGGRLPAAGGGPGAAT